MHSLTKGRYGSLLSFFALAIAGFGVCQASTRLLELPTNGLIKLGLGFFVAMAAVSCIVSQNWLPISRVSQAICWSVAVRRRSLHSVSIGEAA